MKKRVLIIASIIFLMLLTIPPILYLNRPGAAPQVQAIAAMQSSETVTVSAEKWITFTPGGSPPSIGFIFYPGAKVDERAYAPVLHAIAAEGFLVIDVPMPFGLAGFGVNHAEKVMAAFPEIHGWVIGGHSLGGVMAAEFAAGHLDRIIGLALWASYPAEETSLAGTDLAVISISGTRDGLTTPERIAASIPRLPGETVWVAIEGGNHAQFGDYGNQHGDLPAAISPAEQQSQIVRAMVIFLSSLAP